MEIIKTTDLRKSYGKTVALDALNLSVRQGEVFGFIGPNGAGKSTAIRVLLGMLRRDSGEARLFGLDAWENSVELHKRIVYVPGDVVLWPNLSGGEVIDFLGSLHGGIKTQKRKELLDSFQLDPKKKCRSYSKGNRQKVALVSAFASEAELLILDEPTSGLDPLMELVFMEYVKNAKKEGKTVLLSSHILAEVENVCDCVGIIRKGKLVESGTLEQLRHLTRTTITTKLQSPQNVELMPGLHDLTRDGDKWQFSVDASELPSIMTKLSSMGICTLSAEPPTLEELFMRHYGAEVQAKEGNAI